MTSPNTAASSSLEELAETIGRVNGLFTKDVGNGAGADLFADLPPPVDFGLPNPAAGNGGGTAPLHLDDDLNAEAAFAREEALLEQLCQLFPDRQLGNLRSIIRSCPTLDAAIDEVILTQPLEEAVVADPPKMRNPDRKIRGHGAASTAAKRQSVMLRPPSSFGDAPVPAPRRRSSGQGGPIRTIDTEDGFMECPPPPDFVLDVNKVMWDGPADPDDPRFAPIAGPPPPTPPSGHSRENSLDGLDLDDEPLVFNAADEPVVVPASKPTRRRRTSLRAAKASPVDLVKPKTPTAMPRQSPAAAKPMKRPCSTAEFDFGEFGGFGSDDGFGEDEDDFDIDEAIDVSSATSSATSSPSRPSKPPHQETGIPATDEELRRTVEDLVESKLRRAGSARGSHCGSDTESISSYQSESVASTVSVEALSEIVAQTVDRLLKDPRRPNSSGYLNDDPRDSGRHSWGSQRDSRGSLGSAGSPSSRAYSDLGSEGDGEPVFAGMAVPPGHAAPASRDSDYIAGSETMDQLRPAKATTKAKARDQIRRLVSGRGAPLAGQRIFIQRDQRLGFGFSLSGESPSFVHTVIPRGPADMGRDGLLPGDVIMKINDHPVAVAQRSTVLKMIEAVPIGDYLVVVVARTPSPQRKRYPSDPTNSVSTAKRNSAPLVSYSGWLHMLISEKQQLVWQRRWVVLGDRGLHYYASPDGASPVKPLGEISLREACCSACGRSDGMRRESSFKVVYRDSPAVYLSAASAKTMWEWIRRLNLVSKTNMHTLQ